MLEDPSANINFFDLDVKKDDEYLNLEDSDLIIDPDEIDPSATSGNISRKNRLSINKNEQEANALGSGNGGIETPAFGKKKIPSLAHFKGTSNNSNSNNTTTNKNTNTNTNTSDSK